MKASSTTFIFAILLIAAFAVHERAVAAPAQRTQTVLLGETPVKLNVYENKGASITFIAPHFDEQVGSRLVKEAIAQDGGRLLEIESRDAAGKPSRYVTFSFRGKTYRVDPNRVFTANGRRCSGFSGETETAVKSFAEELLSIILTPGGSLRESERFLAAVHNNMNISEKIPAAQNGDLTAYAFVRYDKSAHPSRGAFQKQAEGVYLSNLEEDEDNFIFLSTPGFINYFAEKGFNVVVQKAASKLRSADCGIDDGSLSVFAGQQNLAYINIEADARTGAARQRRMIESVYELLKQTNESGTKTLTAVAEK